jgi:hypothetical protein
MSLMITVISPFECPSTMMHKKFLIASVLGFLCLSEALPQKLYSIRPDWFVYFSVYENFVVCEQF